MSSTATTTGDVEATDRRHPRTAREHGSLVGSGARARGAQEGHLEGQPLWLRHRRQRLLEDGVEEVTEGRVGQAVSPPRPDRRRGSGSRRRAPASPSFHTVVFPMPGSPDRSNALGPLGIESRKRLEDRELRLASDDITRQHRSPRVDGRQDSRDGGSEPCRPSSPVRVLAGHLRPNGRYGKLPGWAAGSF